MVTLPPELLKAPELALYGEQIQVRLAEERARREQFYEALSPDTKAEFINGEVILHSPATVKHNIVRKHLVKLLDTYAAIHKLGLVLDEKTLVSLTRNDYEPDICFFSRDKAAQLKPDQLQLPAPDLIVEVLSPGTESRDRGVKFRDYAAHEVAEYWLVDPDAGVVEQFDLADGQYRLLFKLNSGTLTSRAVAGFEIPVKAIFDAQENLAALRSLMGS